jgi:hypothetical protein
MSRRSLSRHVCEWMGWKGPTGKLKDMSCRKALLELDRRGVLQLPEVCKPESLNRCLSRCDGAGVEPIDIACDLKGLGRVEIHKVTSRYSKASKMWMKLMHAHHYLGSGPLCGAQIRYLIWSSEYGYLGGLSFNSGTWALKKRDEFIGWSERARHANLHRVVRNSRFLIVGNVRVPNLASHVLSQCAKRIAQDWEACYGVEPVLLETFVDPGRFRGSSYRGANWQHVGHSAGRRGGGPKDVYVYPLCSQWREILCAEPVKVLGEGQRCTEPADWVEEELGSAEIYDPRLKRRLFALTRDFYGQPQAPIVQACGSIAKAKAAYRFFRNPKVAMQTVLRAHLESAIERIKEQRVVLAVQDTTTLNYTMHPATQGLGPINTLRDKAVGLIVHDTMGFSVEGTPLGLLDVQCWARDPEDRGKRHRRKERRIEEKESIKWLNSYRAVCEVQKLCPETQLVSVGDRESDIYELFLEASKVSEGPKLLVRCEKTRNRKVGNTPLWERMEKQSVWGFQYLRIPRKGSRPARDAKIKVRYAPVELKPPKSTGYAPVKAWAVYALEVEYAEHVKEPLEWMLLSTVAVCSFEDAIERLDWYSKRWGIEVYHKTLKSGCKIEDRRLGAAERLEACLAIDMVVAWRIYHLTKLGREVPQSPCTVFFEEAEWKALWTFINKTPYVPETEPTLREATRMVASLGGFLGRKGDGNPGTVTLWRGLQRLDDITSMYLALLPYLRAGP